MAGDNHPVVEPVGEYKAMAPFWSMVRDMRNGTRAMRDAGRLYLPQHPAEGETSYFNRLSVSVFTNFYKKTVDKLVGKPLKKPVVLEEDVPEDIVEMMDDIDRNGTDVNVFTRNVLQAAIDDGVTHVLVEFPVATGPGSPVTGDFPDGSLTLAQERALDVRPYARHIKALDLIGWKFFITRSGQKVLTQIRIAETTRKPDPESEFNTIVIPRIRVYDVQAGGPVKVRVFEEINPNSEDNDWIVVEEGLLTIDFIPIVTMYTNKKGFMVGEPLLLDFAYLNIAHWQSDSDQRNIVHVARVPILFATGLGANEEGPASFTLEVGMSTVTKGPKGSTLGYIEHTGKGVEAGQKDLDDLVMRMSQLGLELITLKPGNVTATGKAIDTAEGVSDLGLLAMELESMMEEVLDLFGTWLNKGEEAGGTFSVFKDFGIILSDNEDITSLQAMRTAGDVSLKTYWNELKRRGLLSDDFDPEDEIDLLDAESPRLRDDVDPESLSDEERANTTVGPGVGDTTGTADGHTHTLQDNGVTSEDEGHTHTWSPEATRTGTANGHSHTLARNEE